VGANLLVKDSCRKSGAIQQRSLTNLAPGSRLMHDCCAVDYRLETYPQFLLLLMVGGLQYPVRASVQSLIHTELKPWRQLFWATLYPVQFLLIRVTKCSPDRVKFSDISLTVCGTPPRRRCTRHVKCYSYHATKYLHGCKYAFYNK